MKDFCFPEIINDLISGKSYVFDETGRSDSSVLIFDDMVLKIQKDSPFIRNEHLMMKWLENKVSVPECISNITENGVNYLLMSKISGKMACDDEFMNDFNLLFSVLADAFKSLWETDISVCPVK